MVLRFLLTLTLAAGCAFAQGGRGGGGGGGGGMGEEGGGGMGAGGVEGSGMPRMQRLTKPELFADKLKLNKEQKEQAQEILIEAAQKARPIVEQISRGRQLIGTALIQKKSEADLKPLMDTYTVVSAQMTALEAEAFGKIYAILKPNQQKNAAQSFEILGGMFMPVQTAGRGMSRGQGTGGGQREGGGGSGRGGGINMLGRILLVGLVGSVLVFAQGGRGGGGGGRGGGGGGIAPQGSFGPVNKLDRIHDMLKLTKDQKKDLKQIFDDAQKEATPVHDQINKARVAVGEAVAAGKPQDEVTKAVSAEAALETQMTIIELRAFAKFVDGLDPDQQQRAGMLFQMMRGMFSNKNWNAD